MVHIKTSLCSLSNCGIAMNNITGYYNSVDNPTGFLTTQTPAAFKDYRLDDVYFFTYLVKNNWNGTFTNIPLPGNSPIKVTYDSQKSFDTLMGENLVNQSYNFVEDGYYSVYQFVIPKESIIANVEAAASYTYYVNETTKAVWVRHDNVDTPVDLFGTLVSCDVDWNANNIVLLRSNMISKCFLENCLSTVLEVFSAYYTDPLCVKDNFMLNVVKEKRDLLFAVTNTIQYYVELKQYYQAAKLIYDVSYCNICRDYLASAPASNCGCS